MHECLLIMFVRLGQDAGIPNLVFNWTYLCAILSKRILSKITTTRSNESREASDLKPPLIGPPGIVGMAPRPMPRLPRAVSLALRVAAAKLATLAACKLAGALRPRPRPNALLLAAAEGSPPLLRAPLSARLRAAAALSRPGGR